MSDLEQQASTWVPPWQRLAPEPEPAPLLGDDLDDEYDDIDDVDCIDEPGDADAPESTADTPNATIAVAGAAQSATSQGAATPSAGQGATGRAGQSAAGQGAAGQGESGQVQADQTGQATATPGAGHSAGQGAARHGAGEAKAGLDPDLAAAVAARLGAAHPSNVDGVDGEGGEEAEKMPDLAAAASVMLAHSLAEADAAAAEAKAVKHAGEKSARAERQKKAAKAKPEPEQPQQEPEPEAKPAIVIDPIEVPEGKLVPVLEAILMVVDEPVSELTLSQVLDIPAEELAGVLIDLSARYSAEGRGFDLRRAAGGWRFYTRTEYASYVERFVLDGQQLRLTQASLETLAVVAYKQPVTRSRVSAIRGVNCDGVIKTLVARGMIEECGTEPESGAHLYRTTTLFLEKMGLDTVEQLPPLAPFLPDNLEELAASE